MGIAKDKIKQLREDVKSLPSGEAKNLAVARLDTLQTLLAEEQVGRAAGLYKVARKAVTEAMK